jgi:hypothetical protein
MVTDHETHPGSSSLEKLVELLDQFGVGQTAKVLRNVHHN